MNLERFKKLEDEVKQDLYDYIGKTRTISALSHNIKQKLYRLELTVSKE